MKRKEYERKEKEDKNDKEMKKKKDEKIWGKKKTMKERNYQCDKCKNILRNNPQQLDI